MSRAALGRRLEWHSTATLARLRGHPEGRGVPWVVGHGIPQRIADAIGFEAFGEGDEHAAL